MLQRRTWFGMPPGNPPPSSTTVRLVPLTGGVRPDVAWPLEAPGSAQSMANYLPIDGCLTPRSCFSSLNTLRTLESIAGIAELVKANQNAPQVWLSGGSRHGLLGSNGSISLASFISSFGLGIGSPQTQTDWHYAQVYDAANLSQDMLVATGRPSYDTIQCIYTIAGVPKYSYLTSAPRASTLGVYDNYIVAFNIGTDASNGFDTRVQWCQRGSPSNWTGEGSGFEDLLAMRGFGTAVRATADNRLLLFSTREIWYGVTAAYPAQFQFFPLDTSIGCPCPHTIAECELGLIFVGSDWNLRLLPRGGGVSQVLPGSLAPALRYLAGSAALLPAIWGVYDTRTRCYRLFMGTQSTSLARVFDINVDTGEWAYLTLPSSSLFPVPGCGMFTADARNVFSGNEGLFFGNSTGTVYSTNSLLGSDDGQAFLATWRSGPIAADLPGDYKQLTEVCLDYRAKSRSTVTLKISGDGNTYETVGHVFSLATAPVAGRVRLPVYNGGLNPSIELTSDSTGYTLHRLDATVNLQGRGQ